MKKVHPYRHMRPRRIEISPKDDLSYSVSRYGEDQDIRYGFGACGRAEQEHIQVVEIDFAWLGVVFNIVVTSEQDEQLFESIQASRNDAEAVKQIAKEIVAKYLMDNPQRLLHILETIHEASREQGHLEVIKNTMGAMSVKLNFTDM